MLDLLILVGLGLGAMRGFWTGALRQVASLVGFFVAFLVAVQLMRPVGQRVVESLGLADQLGPVLGFIVIFLVVQIAAYSLARAAEGILRAFHLTFLDRLAGGLVGAFKAALLLSVCFLILQVFEVPAPETREQSELYSPVSSALPAAWSFASERWPEVESLVEKFEIPRDQ